MKKRLKALIVILAVIQMIFGGVVNAFGADEEDDTNKSGTPKISVINGPVFDVEAGKVNEVKVSIKNLSSTGAKKYCCSPKNK